MTSEMFFKEHSCMIVQGSAAVARGQMSLQFCTRGKGTIDEGSELKRWV